jgi:hypothetical protein
MLATMYFRTFCFLIRLLLNKNNVDKSSFIRLGNTRFKFKQTQMQKIFVQFAVFLNIQTVSGQLMPRNI